MESKAPSAEETEAPTTGGGSKAPSLGGAEETKAPSLDVSRATKAPSSDATDPPESNAPTALTFSPAPTALTPSPSKSPSDVASKPFTGDVSIPISFSLPEGQFTDEQLEEILNDEDNKFNDELKESLLELIQLVAEEEFGSSTAKDSGKERSSNNTIIPANVTIDSVQQVGELDSVLYAMNLPANYIRTDHTFFVFSLSQQI
jgi:hypothetical protein